MYLTDYSPKPHLHQDLILVMRFWILSECYNGINSWGGPIYSHWERWESPQAEDGLWQADFNMAPTIPTSWRSQPHIISPPWVWEQHAICFQPIEYDKSDGMPLRWWHYFTEDSMSLTIPALKKQAAMSPIVPRTWILPKGLNRLGRGPFPSRAKMRSQSWLTPWWHPRGGPS